MYCVPCCTVVWSPFWLPLIVNWPAPIPVVWSDIDNVTTQLLTGGGSNTAVIVCVSVALPDIVPLVVLPLGPDTNV